MNGWHQPLRRFAFIAVLSSILGGCAVVPYGAPHYHDYPPRVYGPPVVVPLPFYQPWHHGHHGHHGRRGHRGRW